MKRAVLSIIMSTFIIGISACSSQEGSAVMSSNALAEVEIPEPEDNSNAGLSSSDTGSILPEGLEDIPNSSDVEIPEGEEIVEGTTLTESELEALRSDLGYSIETAENIYKQVTEGGGIDYGDGTYTNEAVGSPYDTSWRQMTDAEAQAILNGEAEGNKAAAEAELLNGAWLAGNGSAIYFDYYQWLADVKGDMEANSEYIMNPETDIRHANEQ